MSNPQRQPPHPESDSRRDGCSGCGRRRHMSLHMRDYSNKSETINAPHLCAGSELGFVVRLWTTKPREESRRFAMQLPRAPPLSAPAFRSPRQRLYSTKSTHHFNWPLHCCTLNRCSTARSDAKARIKAEVMTLMASDVILCVSRRLEQHPARFEACGSFSLHQSTSICTVLGVFCTARPYRPEPVSSSP